LADDILRETQADDIDPSWREDFGGVSSFYIYPVAEALSIKGLYHYQTALLDIDVDFDIRRDHYRRAAEFYIKAAERLPEDEDFRLRYLVYALECMWRCRTPIKIILPTIELIESALPKVNRIWEAIRGKDGHNFSVQQALWFAEDARKGIADGQLTLDSMILPEHIAQEDVIPFIH